MRVLTAGLIDKSSQSRNKALQKQLRKNYQKNLGIQGSAITSQEVNTFIVVSATGNSDGKRVDDTIMEKIEKTTHEHFLKYYTGNKSRFQRELSDNQELRETSGIIKDFVKEVDPHLAEILDSRLEEISRDLPNMLCETQMKSIITLWHNTENGEYRFSLSGFDSPIFNGSTSETDAEFDKIADKLLFANFFRIFLRPTITRLQEMDQVLEKLRLGIKGVHYRSEKPKLQAKLELFFRILAANLSALQDLGSVNSRIFDLFQVPHHALTVYQLENEDVNLNLALAETAQEIEQGKALLLNVQDKLQKCQIHLRDYLDERKNKVETISSIEDFREKLQSIPKLSIELFAEAELLKTWKNLFGSDIPYFSFNKQLLDTEDHEFNSADDSIITVRGLTKNYNLGKTTVYAIRGVNLDIKEGEFVAILGNSGAGKTTLLNCIAGLDTPDHGVVLFHGKNLHEMSDNEKSKSRLFEMGFIFQNYTLLPHFNTRENIALPADLAGLSKNLKDHIEKLLEGVGIDQQARQYPATLSGGQMQRVAIARALTNSPAVIFADEPTGDLDSVTGKQVMDLLKKFHEETRTTIILITHEQDIADYAERQILMEDGVITTPQSFEQAKPRTKIETQTSSQEETRTKPSHHFKITLAALIAQIGLAALISFLLLQIDQLVHGTLYSYNLQFSRDWAIPYWTFLRSALGILLTMIGLNALLIAYIIHKRRN